jgi:hypothetical protein
MWIPSRGKVVYYIGETAQRPKVYLIKANGFNSQQIAFASSVDIATGDTPETCGDPDFPKNQQADRLQQRH